MKFVILNFKSVCLKSVSDIYIYIYLFLFYLFIFYIYIFMYLVNVAESENIKRDPFAICGLLRARQVHLVLLIPQN